jgi:dTDP-4-amino-4,6-dideoxygalactose transaminase
MNFKIPFSGVGAKYSNHEKEIVLEAMDTSETLTQGKYQAEFEKNFSQFVGMKHCFATSCAAGALELAATIINLKSGDEVVCPAHTYNASAYPFAKHGAKLVWADINRDTWVCDVMTLDAVVTKNTKAIVVVHLYGAPANMLEIMRYAKSKNILVIEDCAQAIGASVSGRPVGSFGDISIFSFHSHKNISTLGEGGMICTNTSQYAKLIPGLRHNGHAPYDGRDPRYYWKPAMSNVDVDIEGIWPNNFCIGEVQCALGSAMLPRIQEINNLRRRRFLKFEEASKNIQQITLQKFYPSANSTHHLLPFLFFGKFVSRDLIIEKLAYEYGIQAIVQYYPLNRYPLFYKNGFGEASIPSTDKLFDNMVSLPFHQWMSEDDFDYVINSTIECINKYDAE